MLHIGDLIYLDTEKTGSSFLVGLFRKHFDQKEHFFRRHSQIPAHLAKSARGLKLISIREPISYYESLYRYGLDGKGAIYSSFKHHGKGSVYEPTDDAFLRWVILLNQSEPYGILSRRLMRISATQSPKSFLDVVDYGYKRQIGRARNPLKLVWTDRIADDLLRHSGISPNLQRCAERANSEPRINSSKNPFRLSAETKQTLLGSNSDFRKLESMPFALFESREF